MPTIILIANHPNDRRESMDRYVAILESGLRQSGLSVEVIRPTQSFAWIARRCHSLGKWLAYFDKFIRFPLALRLKLRRKIQSLNQPVIHICDQADAIYVHHLKGFPHLVTCHDLFAIRSARGEFPQQTTRLTGRVYQTLIAGGLRKAANVLCVSETTRLDLARFGPKRSQRVSVIKNPLNYPYQPVSARVSGPILNNLFNKFGINTTEQYLFHVGGNQWYKNRPGLIRIYHAMTQLGPMPRLVLAGQPLTRELSALIEELGLTIKISVVGKVTNEELNALYGRAEALVFPSLMEGFGWPIIEAQAAGCPVLASDIAIFREIGGTAVHFINPNNVATAAETICAFLADAAEAKQQARQGGIANASAFQLEGIIAKYGTLYHGLVGLKANKFTPMPQIINTTS